VWAVVALLGSAPACNPSTAEGTADAGDGDSGPHGGDGGGSGGLSLVFSVSPQPTADLPNKVRLTEVHLHLFNVRAIGDAAPGDSRTTKDKLTLDFKKGQMPGALVFDAAPPGLYSRVEWTLSSLGDGVKIRGTVDYMGAPTPFVVEDELPASISLPISVALAAGGSAEIDVELDVAHVLDGIDWANAELESGTLHVEGSSDVHQKLQTSFKILTPP
jgi:hypothetical protein